MSSSSPSRGAGLPLALVRWLDSWAGLERTAAGAAPRTAERTRSVDWPRVVPFLALHLAVAAVLVVGWSPVAVAVAVLLYVVRMFAITAAYHRYFSHRAFRTSRAGQLVLAVLGASAVQRGPLWWASHHRLHHRHSDTERDTHSPARDGFWWSHVGWIVARENFHPRLEAIRDFARFPELRFLDRFDALVPALLAAGLFGLGELLAAVAPGLGTSGPQLLVWGFVISTVALYHLTFAINSVAHRFGRRRWATPDDSRNHALLALLTLGEGWHNNHHRYPAAARQGFRWWEIDLTWYALLLLERLGLVWDLRPVPAALRARRSEP